MKFRFFGVLVFLFVLSPGRLLSQGIFAVFSFPRTVTVTGQTEVAGAILLILRQGPISQGTLVIDVAPLRITNSATDISVTVGGDLVGKVGSTEIASTSTDVVKNLVRIPVAAGATSGFIRIEGIRVGVAGTGISSSTLRLSWDGGLNVFLPGIVTTINSVQSGLTADPITDHFVIFNGRVVDSTSKITVHEGHPAAFSSSTAFGQTVSTRIRIRVTDYPDNVLMTFPPTVSSLNTGATLTTIGGSQVVLSKNGSNTVTYGFSGVAESDESLESFDIPFTVAIDPSGPAGLTQPTFEVTLAPIGAAVPDSTFTSTDIPRYAEDEILLQAGTSRTITKVLYWTGVSSSNLITVFNPSSSPSNLTVEALNSSGQTISGAGVTNPVKMTLSTNQSLVQTPSGFFGGAAGIASIRIQSTNPEVLATVTVSGRGVSESVPLISNPLSSLFVPVVNEGAQLYLMNPNTTAVSGTLTLRGQDGRDAATVPVSLAPLASTSVLLASAFNNPSAGYVFATFSNLVVGFESFGNSSDLSFLAIQPPASVNALLVPFFAAGGGFQTDINILNLSSDTVTLTAQLFDGTGATVATNASITIPLNEQVAVPINRLFGNLPATGYIRFDVTQLLKGFFPFFPAIAGHARIQSAQGGATVVPLSAYPLQDSFIFGSGAGAGEFQGLALVNPAATAAIMTLQAISSTGTVLSNNTLTLNPGQVISRLITEFIPSGVPPQSVIRVTSSAPIVVTAISGSNTLDALRSLPVLR